MALPTSKQRTSLVHSNTSTQIFAKTMIPCFKNVSAFLFLMCMIVLPTSAQQTDVIMQGFYWNTNPGDVSDNATARNSGGIWWDSLKTVAPELGKAGFGTVWFPPASKGGAGRFDMGYGLYDYYDLGQFDWKASVRTRFGNRTQLQNAVGAMKANGIKVMADVVLNHRDGADAQADNACGLTAGGTVWKEWFVFNPRSGRFPATAVNFNPTPTGDSSSNCKIDGDYFQAFFGRDNAYFNNTNNVLIPGAAGNGWYFGPHNVGNTADSLVVWGRWLVNTVGFDEFRIDAVKHIQPAFLAPWLVETKNGEQPFAMGEFYDGSAATLKWYAGEVNNFNGTFGRKNANLAMLDFNLYFWLKGMLNNGSGSNNMQELNGTSLLNNGMAPQHITTFVENHDFDRGGYEWDTTCTNFTIRVGAACLKYKLQSDHNPVFRDKQMGYSMILAMEPRPVVFWKDYYWYGMRQEIDWLLNLRKSMAKGGTVNIGSDQFNGLKATDLDRADFWAMQRNGNGSAGTGLIYAVNDNASSERSAWVNTPWANSELKDYSDAYMFVSSQVYGDYRAFVKAGARNYAWWAPTGRYTIPNGEDAARFNMTAAEGGKVHYIVLRASDVANLQVNGAPIAVGDQVAVMAPGTAKRNVAGMGRIGQAVTWDGVNDMLIEVLGNATGNVGNRLAVGNDLKLVVYDKSQNALVSAENVTWLSNATAFNFKAKRPGSRGASSFGLMVNNATGKFSIGAISVVTGFNTNMITASEADRQEQVTGLTLNPIYPNPLNQEGVISFKVAQDQKVKVALFDALGRTLDLLFEGTVSAGVEQRLVLSATDLSNGTYWVKISNENGENAIKSFTVVR
jgi:alpha-amylase